MASTFDSSIYMCLDPGFATVLLIEISAFSSSRSVNVGQFYTLSTSCATGVGFNIAFMVISICWKIPTNFWLTKKLAMSVLTLEKLENV